LALSSHAWSTAFAAVRAQWAAQHNPGRALLALARRGDLELLRQLCVHGAAGSLHAGRGAVLRCAAARGDAELARFVVAQGGAPQVRCMFLARWKRDCGWG
jgi:hypothetical protein